MAWQVNFDPVHGIVEVVYTGLVTAKEIEAAVVKRISLLQETGATAMLIDSSGIEQLTAEIADIYDLPDKLFLKRGAPRQTRMAFVLAKSKEVRELAQFWETVCLNRGWQVKTFENRQDAVNWLTCNLPPR